MSENCYTLITNIGKAKIANSIPFGTKVNFTKFKVGDGNGIYYEPTESQVDLVNTKWEGPIGSVYVDENNSNWIVVDTVIPADIGGFFVREAGIFDDKNNLIAISKLSESYKPVFTDGTTKEMLIRLILEVSNTSSVTLKIDPAVILATKKDIQILDSKVQTINAQLSDWVYQIATGTATVITLTTQTLVNGYAKTFIASANNNGAATTINGKKLYKPNTTVAPNLIAGKAYTVWYNVAGDCFFIKASAEGDADVSHVLATKKFSNDNDTGLVGTMPNNGALNANLNCGGSFNIPTGYTSGGKINANSLASQTVSDATSADIVNGKTAYINGNKITGNATIQSLGGKRFATGTATATWPTSGNSWAWITPSLPFTPRWFSAKGTVIKYGTTTTTIPVNMIYNADVGTFILSSSGMANLDTTPINFTQPIKIYVGDTMAQSQPANAITWYACE